MSVFYILASEAAILNTQFDLKTYDYDFPQELLAHQPCSVRSLSKLLDFSSGERVHRKFCDLVRVFKKPCLFVRNNTQVLKSKIRGRKVTGARVEGLLYHRLEPGLWEALLRPGRRLHPEDQIILDGGARCRIIKKRPHGGFLIHLDASDDLKYLENSGELPLPPYIEGYGGDLNRYQTVYASRPGAAAAPTAGLHFDDNLLSDLIAEGHRMAEGTLHVGPGTFKPIQTQDIREFPIHHEWIELDQKNLDLISQARSEGLPVVAVGTTSLRVLETTWRENQLKKAFSGMTDLYLYPGQKIHSADYLITNFHLPRTSLLVLCAALVGPSTLREIYQDALKNRYRLFSFGDSMCLPNWSQKLSQAQR